jgi:uncharacterized protein (UPF0332 family)
MREVRDFIEKAERFFRSAESLFTLEDYDSCASRCYYAMFFLAEAALMTQGISPSSHRGVISLFGRHFIRAGILPAEFGRALSRAYDVRLTGDYAVGIAVSRDEAQDLLELTRRFVARLRAYLESQEENKEQ